MADPLLPGLPAEIRDVIRSAIVTEFATVSAAGVPIDTPTFCFFDGSQGSLDIATGVAYPAKAERARRNPHVGLLLEGGARDPVISIAAVAAVRDADIQANLVRYVAETIAYFAAYSGGHPWSVARQSTWYWARIFVCCVPHRIYWWPCPAQLDEVPQRWTALDANRLQSDPEPDSPVTSAPNWGARDWQECAAQAAAMRAHLTVLDSEGFPLPFPARTVKQTSEGFELTMAKGIPWSITGKASLCFVGTFTFIGAIVGIVGGIVRFRTERVLPTLPTVSDSRELWQPSETTRVAFQDRLERELMRRGQPMPQVPLEPPLPTQGSVLRAERMARLVDDGATRPAND